ncbi:MAG: hypothetical protein HYV97_12085 [Bdellovibrio sp.]|nr:hypothetical protein [Bdellovibrio sp.]
MNSILKTIIIVLAGMFLIKISIADQMRSNKNPTPIKVNQNKIVLPRISASR